MVQHFFYDAQGQLSIVDFNGTKYGYIHNLQGAVIAIIDGNGNRVVEYSYDAWGKPRPKPAPCQLHSVPSAPSATEAMCLIKKRAFTTLYSRYYNPVWE